jgi:hypothetical protein
MDNEKIELTDEKFLEAIKEANLGDSLAKYTQKIGDKRVSEGIDSFKKNQDKKNFSDSEKITNLENELKEMKDNTAKNSLDNSIKASLKEAGLSKGFAKYIKVDKEEDIGTAVKDLTDNILELKQFDLDNKLKGNEPPVKGDITGTGSGMETAARDYAKKISVNEEK